MWAQRLWTMPELGQFLWLKWWQRKGGARLSSTCVLAANIFHGKLSNFSVGDFSCIGRVYVQAHEKITIGRCVVINDDVKLITGSHDINSTNYDHIFLPIIVEDYAWIATGAIILQGVSIGRGAVVAAGAVVTRDVTPFTVVGGNPAHTISHRANLPFSYLPSTWFRAITAWVGRNENRSILNGGPVVENEFPRKQ